MFKAIFIRIIIKLIKKSFIIIITTLTTRIIFIIEIIYVSIMKFKQKMNTKINTKKLIYYIYNKIDYYRKNCIVQNQTNVEKKILKKTRLYHLNINEK